MERVKPQASWISCTRVLFLGTSTPLIAQFGLPVSKSRRPQGGCVAGYPAILSGALGLPEEVNTTDPGRCPSVCSFSGSVSTTLYSLSGPRQQACDFRKPKDAPQKDNMGDPCSGGCPRLEGPAALFSISQDGGTLRFYQATLRRIVPAAAVCREHPAVPTAGLTPGSALAKMLLASNLFLEVVLKFPFTSLC